MTLRGLPIRADDLRLVAILENGEPSLCPCELSPDAREVRAVDVDLLAGEVDRIADLPVALLVDAVRRRVRDHERRSEEPASELMSLMCISYAVICLKKNNNKI